MRSFFGSLRFRLIALVSAALLPAVAVIVYEGLEDRRLAITAAQGRLQHLVALVAREQEQLIQGTRQLLQVLAQLPEVRRRDAACEAGFTSIREQSPAYDNLGLIGRDGYVIVSVHPLAAPVYLGDREHVQQAVKTKKFAMSGLQISRILQKPTLVCNYPVLDESGQVQAVLFINLTLDWLQSLAARIRQLLPGRALTSPNWPS